MRRGALRRALAGAALLCAAALPARAEEVVLGLSQNRVSITANFDGSEILIFGAVKREREIQPEPPLQVIVTVAGPSTPVWVRRKERVLGIWANTDAVMVDRAPSFYAVATSAPWNEVLRDVEDLRHRVSIPRAIRAVGVGVADPQAFTRALIRIRQAQDLYQMRESTVTVQEQTLFRTSIQMPANLTEGGYETRIFLTRGGRVINAYETVIDVRKVGLERFLYNLSRERPLIYGLMSLAIAIAAGWGASEAFRVLRRA